jgi:CDP-diacylglycerol--glycerol-3-phosphate 3-phosphatidyltransferase
MKEEETEMSLRNLKNVPCLITLSRIVLVGVLWWLAVAERLLAPQPQEKHILFGALFALCVFTDTLDGYIARRWKLMSSRGAKLDNLADTLVFLSLVGWVGLLLPGLLRNNVMPIAGLLGLYLGDLALQHLRHGRRVPLHLFSGKTASWVLYLFVLHAMLFGLNEIFKWVTFGVVLFSLSEEIFLLSTRRDLDETVISAFTRRRRPGPSSEKLAHA